MKSRIPLAIGAMGAATVLLSGCVSFTGDADAGGDTVVMAITSDIGNLDPQSQTSNDLTQFKNLTYDRLINENAETGDIEKWLATAWKEDLHSARFTIDSNAKCDDGSVIDADVVAENYRQLVAPDSTSPFKGISVPADLTVEVEGKDVILSTKTDYPFFLRSVGGVPIVCKAGLEDRKALATKSFGTGPFILDKTVSGTEYRLVKREGYTWGPGGMTSDVDGFPANMVLRIVGNETTAANLLLSGELNIAMIQGPDRARVEAAKIPSQDYEVVIGEFWFNQDQGRVAQSEKVRRALSEAANLDELAPVVSSGKGSRPKSMITLEPVACPADVIGDRLPKHDLTAAAAALESEGWRKNASGVYARDGKTLSINMVYPSKWGQPMADAAELMTENLKAFGVDASVRVLDAPAMSETLFKTGDFDIAWSPFTMDNPRLLAPLVRGANPRDGGQNFGSIKNEQHDALVAAALKKAGTEGCPEWNEAESTLIDQVDVVPFQTTRVPIFTRGVTADVVRGSIAPWSIRMAK
ncbi:ABC transporter substrate-binding protein [Microbacterium sp.]|uniref:ABC transporter substrate-binding protein n=1 Tax=Microbacterium sp. TaxID=51671 RepID=UPI003341B227